MKSFPCLLCGQWTNPLHQFCLLKATLTSRNMLPAKLLQFVDTIQERRYSVMNDGRSPRKTAERFIATKITKAHKKWDLDRKFPKVFVNAIFWSGVSAERRIKLRNTASEVCLAHEARLRCMK